MLLFVSSLVTAQTKITTLQEALSLAEKNSYTTEVGILQKNLASLTTSSSYFNAFNPRIPLSAALTNNTSLPVTFVPGEAFGGKPGTLSPITLGIQYVSTFNLGPQFEILNFGNLAKIKSAKANEVLVNNNQLVIKKNLFDQINAAYHNILSFQSQISVLKVNKAKADTLFEIVSKKYIEGLARLQDQNDAQINVISIEDKIQQMMYNLDQQYLNLALLCETNEKIEVSQKLSDLLIPSNLKSTGDLTLQNAVLQQNYALAEKRASYLANLPTLSFISSYNIQNNNKFAFFDKNNNWNYNSFWSLRFAWDIPTNVPKLTAYKSNQINAEIAATNAKHAQLQNKIQNEQMEKDYDKAQAQLKNNLLIYKLKQENFEKSKNQYLANILSLDKLLVAQNDLLTSEINVQTCLANISFNKSKIEINNQIK